MNKMNICGEMGSFRREMETIKRKEKNILEPKNIVS